LTTATAAAAGDADVEPAEEDVCAHLPRRLAGPENKHVE
jgi:hypothetical protein